MEFVDTNTLLRWLLNDHTTLSPKAIRLVDTATPGSLLVTEVIIAEVVYVLRGTGYDRQQTAEALLLVGAAPAFQLENEALANDIVALLVATKLDFADCYLLARARREKHGLATFDKALAKRYRAENS